VLTAAGASVLQRLYPQVQGWLAPASTS
jgi:hypothetical protein